MSLPKLHGQAIKLNRQSLHLVSSGAISAPISVDMLENIDIAVKPNQP
ncbi:MAG: hypothetical protein V7K92_30560 [Nostoc sp.]